MMNRLAAVIVVMVMGLTAFGAKAATTDNLQIEVRVTIPATTDLQWATGTTGIGNGSNEYNATTDPKNDVSLGVNDLAVWEMLTADFSQVWDTSTGGNAAAVNFYLDNVGKKAVNVSASISQFDSSANVTGSVAWKADTAPAVSKYSMKVKGNSHTTGGTSAIATLPSTSFAALLTGENTSAPVSLATGFTRNNNWLSIDLEYSTPTEVTNDTELDIPHTTVITITGTSN